MATFITLPGMSFKKIRLSDNMCQILYYHMIKYGKWLISTLNSVLIKKNMFQVSHFVLQETT